MLAFLQQFFLSHPELGYLLLFAAVFAESLGFVGVFVPGTAVVVLAGFLAEAWGGPYNIFAFLLLTTLGAFLGSATTYLLGRYYGPPLFSEKNFYLKRRYLERTQEYFEAHGGSSVFTGQFTGPLRSFIPLVAGMAEMGYGRFFIWTFVASVAWSAAHLGLGYFFGTSWEAVQLWGTRLSLFIILIAIIVFLNWLLGRFLVRHERQVRAVAVSVGRSVMDGFLGNEYVAMVIRKYPRFFRFLKHRLSRRKLTGLPLTLAFSASFVIILYLLVLVRTLIVSGPLLPVDQRLLAAVMFVRDPVLTPIMQFITNLAGWPVIGIVACISVALWIDHRHFRALVLITGATSAALLQTFFKYIFERARPDQALALITEPTPSFPSGHAVMAVVVYGFVLFALLPHFKRWRTKIFAALLSATFIFLVGFSRLYLGVHWPSDVLGGYLLGGWWLVTMVTVTYIGEHSFAPPGRRELPRLAASVLVFSVLVAALSGTAVYGAYHPLKTVAQESIAIVPLATADHFSTELLQMIPKQTETLNGAPQAPINLVFVGSRQTVVGDFTRAGWQIADPIDLSSVFKIVHASLENSAYATAPISPSFYQGRVQDLGIQQSTSADSVRQRHHLRLWLAPLSLKDGTTVWLASASFDQGVGYSAALKFPTHIINPDIDAERDYVMASLAEAGVIDHSDTVQMIAPVLGVTGAGSPFFTDGEARVLWLRPSASAAGSGAVSVAKP